MELGWIYFLLSLMWLMRALVEESWVATLALPASSGSIALASCLPSSTPHWSYEFMSQIMPCRGRGSEGQKVMR